MKTPHLLFSIVTISLVFLFLFPQTLNAQTRVMQSHQDGQFIVPCGVSSIKVEVWGAGGGGGYSSWNGQSTGGGGGGGHATKTLNVSEGMTFYYQVGTGGAGGRTGKKDGGNTWFNNLNTRPISNSTYAVMASGGQGVGNNEKDGGAGGAGIYGTSYKGGNGGNGYGLSGRAASGGGGGAARATAHGSSGGDGNNNHNGGAGGSSSSPGGAGGNGTDEGGAGDDGFDYGGGGGGGKKALLWIVNQDGGDGGKGLVRISYTIDDISPVEEITSSQGSELSCDVSSTILTASGGNIAGGVSTLWYEGNQCPSIPFVEEFNPLTYPLINATVQSQSNGNLRLKAQADAGINMENILSSASFNPAIHKYFVFRYKIIADQGGEAEIYFKKASLQLSENAVVRTPLINDGQWHITTVNMADHPLWNSENGGITGWRFDFATIAGTVMDLDYIILSSVPILENTSETDTQISVTPSYSESNFGVLRISETKNSCNPVASCTEIPISRLDKTYRGTGDWSDPENWIPYGVPRNNHCVIIPDGFTMNLNTLHAAANSIRIESTGKLTLSKGSALTVVNEIINLATPDSFVVSSDASLLQINPAVNIGQITVKREANVPHNQYNFWSSPVKNQGMYQIYPVPANHVMTYNTATDYYNVVPSPAPAAFGKGYSIKGPATNTAIDLVKADFIGVPNNESVSHGENVISVLGTNNGFNLIGNPFPSNFDLKLFYEANKELFLNADFFFWDNTGNTVLEQQGTEYNSYINHNYAIYNAKANTGVKAPGGGPKVPNGIVKPGQGFIMRANSNANLQIGNIMRTNKSSRSTDGTEAPYFRNENGYSFNTYDPSALPAENKFWLELINPDGIQVQMAVGYFEDADDNWDEFDTGILSEAVSENIYSFSADAQKLTINGLKAPFHKGNVIPLGMKLFQSGTYTIHLSDKMGVFNRQAIYIQDKWLNKIYNLSESDYEFTSLEGVLDDRFEIIFNPNKLMTSQKAANQLKIQKVNSYLEISSDVLNLTDVEIFNITGFSEFKRADVNSRELRIPLAGLSKQILFIKVRTESGEIHTKKMVNH